jgi:hypothetical protein
MLKNAVARLASFNGANPTDDFGLPLWEIKRKERLAVDPVCVHLSLSPGAFFWGGVCSTHPKKL